MKSGKEVSKSSQKVCNEVRKVNKKSVLSGKIS